MGKWKIFLHVLILHSLVGFSAEFQTPEFYKIESTWISNSGEKFKLCRISTNGALKIIKEKKIKVHFKEGVAEVSKKYQDKLDRFFKKLPKNTFNIKISAHADSCGDRDYNNKLAQKRGLNVYDYIKELIPPGVQIKGENNGEEKARGHNKHDKFVEVIAEYWITDEEFNQVVLFDISGSLHEKKIGRTYTGYKLNGLKQIKLEKGTIAYVPRDPRYKCEGTDLANYTPVGEDFYWEAMTLITTAIKGSVQGTTYTDDTDPRGRKKEQIFNQQNNGRINWEIR